MIIKNKIKKKKFVKTVENSYKFRREFPIRFDEPTFSPWMYLFNKKYKKFNLHGFEFEISDDENYNTIDFLLYAEVNPETVPILDILYYATLHLFKIETETRRNIDYIYKLNFKIKDNVKFKKHIETTSVYFFECLRLYFLDVVNEILNDFNYNVLEVNAIAKKELLDIKKAYEELQLQLSTKNTETLGSKINRAYIKSKTKPFKYVPERYRKKKKKPKIINFPKY